MKRFVDIRNQGTGCRFAFWDTISDTFDMFSGTQAWDSWNDFAEDYIGKELERYRGLCPDWVHDGKEDDIEGWYES